MLAIQAVSESLDLVETFDFLPLFIKAWLQPFFLWGSNLALLVEI